MSDYIAIGREGAEYMAFAIENGATIGPSRGPDEAAALKGLPTAHPALTIAIGTGTPDAVPCSVLPENAPIVPVITQDAPSDVLDAWLRLRVAGYLAQHKNWDGVIWAIDTDISQWIHVSADEIISFTSFLTPRLVAALKGATPPAEQALTDTMSRPERLAAHLRQAELSGDSRAMTGHLLGAELAAARPYWLGQQVALIPPEGNDRGYVNALESQGVPVDVIPSDAALKEGLMALADCLKPIS